MPLPPQGYKPPQKNTFGGFNTATIYSGNPVTLTAAPGSVAAGSDVLFWSGAGRLDFVSLFNLTTSGLAMTFYDSHAPAPGGGPIPASGHKVIGVVPSFAAGSLVATNIGPQEYAPIQISIPFQSGLCVHFTSGQVNGFTVAWTPEVADQ